MAHKALGRGLEALLKPVMGGGGGDDRSSISKIAVEKIRPNRHQPRVRFTPDSLQELADSIKIHGLAQPLLVSPSAVPGEFELVAGERRLRAARMAGLVDVPCVIRPVTDRERHELSLIENIQRENLNAIEEAESMRKLMDEAGLTQEDMAKRLGKSRSGIANKLRLLELSQMIRNALMEGLLTEGHARALLGLEGKQLQEDLAKRVVQEKLNVRDVERLVAEWSAAPERPRPAKRKNPDVRVLEEELQRHLGRRVVVDSRGKDKGWVRLEFYSVNDLEVLTQQLRGRGHHK
ncbi:MAG TPA: ParB/RepB/Spo0J family partition protein [Elusimicrobiota bacterium]|nr:ParB/RepB/Spo0J family partition protein [Elusimicrobiota bacterium]